ncbi:tetraspanin-8 [Bombina bombina]|uniref:tetraspanin-8 n=1 Tax=Bombina bombina TaxID=8345 RepID=UPI00235AA282|nr:tetraspanin-8 [Bombina bombina]
MAGVSKCLKYSMFVFNFLFWVCGCIILGISIWLRVSKDAQKELGDNMLPAIDLMIAVGAIIMVLGFFGCCGAIKESKCLLLLFFIGLFLILALQVTAGILGAVYKSKIEDEVNKTLNNLLPLSGQSNNFIASLDAIQQESKCCGIVDGYSDWSGSIPKSCICTASTESHPCVTYQGKLYYKQSCATAISDLMKKNLIIIIGVAFGLALIELVGLGFSMTLYCQIKKK